MALEAVFIDAGNTLLYEKPSRFEIYALAARRMGVDLSTGAMLDLMRLAHRELPREIDGAFRYSEGWFASYIERIFHHHLGISKGDLPSIGEELFARFAQPSTFVLHEGARELLEGLSRRGLRVGVVSNWSQRLPGILEGLGLAPHLRFVLASAIERVEKPSPEIFLRACARSGVPPRAALHAGDDLEKDVLGARAAGLQAVHVDRDGRGCGGNGADPETGWSRVGSLLELSELISRLP